MIGSYDELRSQIAKWLGRTTDPELAANIPNFIDLFEREARQRLTSRVGEVRSVNSTISAEYTALPDDFIRVRAAKRLAPQPGLLQIVPDSTIDAMADEVGVPVLASVAQRSLRLYPVPSSAVSVQLTYTTLPSLSASVPTNWLLDMDPQAYLYGAMAHAARFLDDERADNFEARAVALLENINLAARPMRSTADLRPMVVGSVV